VWLVKGAAKAAAGFLGWIVGLPIDILQGLANFAEMLVGWITDAFDWIVANGPSILKTVGDWLIGIPQTILGWLGDLGSMLWGWMKGAWDWLVGNGPGILSGLWAWVSSIPGTVISTLGDIGSTLWGWLKSGFDWVVTKGPDLLSGMLDFFGSIPGRIFGAISSAFSAVGGFAADVGRGLYNGVAGFINSNLIDKIRGFSAFGFKPFDGLPELPIIGGPAPKIPGTMARKKLADGGVFDRATEATVGEAGLEVVIPLTRPMRALQLAHQSGLVNVLATARNGGATAAQSAQPSTSVAMSSGAPTPGLFPGAATGNTYNIYGISMAQVIAEIQAREEASSRVNFARR
jgi:phage-related protein